MGRWTPSITSSKEIWPSTVNYHSYTGVWTTLGYHKYYHVINVGVKFLTIRTIKQQHMGGHGTWPISWSFHWHCFKVHGSCMFETLNCLPSWKGGKKRKQGHYKCSSTVFPSHQALTPEKGKATLHMKDCHIWAMWENCPAHHSPTKC